MSEVIKVGMADLNVCKAPDVITTLGLGSCIRLSLSIIVFFSNMAAPCR